MELFRPAIFSPCRRWRYTLRRIWEPDLLQDLQPGRRKLVAFIGLNPSTADEFENDPTVRRCINYAHRWGYGGMFMLNIFAWRDTNPEALYRLKDPIGPENDDYIRRVVQMPEVTLVIACWGNHAKHLHRGWEMLRLLKAWEVNNLCRLGSLTSTGQPRHPLYLKGDLMPIPFYPDDVVKAQPEKKFTRAIDWR